MLDIFLLVACIILGFCLLNIYLKNKNNTKELEEYKVLLQTNDLDYKTSQQTIQNLFEDMNNKNVLLERGTNAINIANNKLQEQINLVKYLYIQSQTLKEKIEFQDDQYKKLMSQKKSSEVRTGKIAEQISPFLKDYPLNPRTARFIGDPLDFVHFDEDQVTFVEVKSGKSQLSKKQRHIRDLIKAGKVNFIIYRVEGN